MSQAANPKPDRGRVQRALLVLAALLGVALVGTVARLGMTPAIAPTRIPASAAPQAPTAIQAAAPVHKAATPAAAKPAWADLTPEQQKALAPLASEWDHLPAARKKKWLAIGNKFATMSAAEQQRVHKRMSEWMQLTPQQRRVARDSYSRAKKLEPNQKSARWEQYQQLPDEQKEKLANTAIEKRVATLPPANSKSKIVAPIKSTPKPVLEQALTPQPATHPAAQSLPAPAPEPPPAPATSAAASPPVLPAPVTPAPAPVQTPAPVDPTQF